MPSSSFRRLILAFSTSLGSLLLRRRIGYIVEPYRIRSKISLYFIKSYKVVDYFPLLYRFPIGPYRALSDAKSSKQGLNVYIYSNKIIIVTLLISISKYNIVVE